VASLSRSSGTDGSLTWEVPPALERSFGPSHEAVSASAQLEQHQQQELERATQDCKQGDSPLMHAADAAACDTALVSVGSSAAQYCHHAGSKGGSPLTFNTGSPGLHPLVQLNGHEFSKAADAHLELLLHQLLVAEDVADAERWLPIVLRLASDAAQCVLPAAAAAFGEQDPRFYVKASATSRVEFRH